MTIAADLIADFRREHAHNQKLLAAVPEAKFGWQPHEKSMSLGRLAGHLAENPGWLPSMLEDEMDFAAMGDYAPFDPATSGQLLETYEKGAATFEPMLRDKDDAFLRGTWSMKMGDKLLMQAPRCEVIRDFMIHHPVHHRGQLTVYLRLLDVAVPATYGNTADDAGAMGV